jgi:tRNA (guanosine-2'-O-)-methyltransferase
VSAVLRSAEAMGLQQVHVVELLKRFKKANRVTQGAEKWLDILRWPETKPCVRYLKRAGFRIVATAMEDARPIDELAFDRPTALVFGNEHEGVTDELLGMSDERVRIPMDGFTGSFNISVAAALAFYHIRQDRIRRLGRHGDLSGKQRKRLKAAYYMRSVGNAERLLLRARSA